LWQPLLAPSSRNNAYVDDSLAYIGQTDAASTYTPAGVKWETITALDLTAKNASVAIVLNLDTLFFCAAIGFATQAAFAGVATGL
jgi:hypothetical protein